MRPTERNSAQVSTAAIKSGADVSMVSRVSAILDAFTHADATLGVSELARRTGLAKSSTHRIVQELIAHRFLERNGHGVRLGLKVFELGELASRPRDLRKVALASMSDLRNAVHLTTHLAVLERGEVVYIEVLPARGLGRLPSRVGGRMPAHATGVGKALLAFSDPQLVEELLSAPLRRLGPNTATDPERLRAELARIRDAGVAYENGESGAGIACAAAVVQDAGGTPVAAISAAGWATSFDPHRVGLAVRTAAQAITRELARRPALQV